MFGEYDCVFKIDQWELPFHSFQITPVVLWKVPDAFRNTNGMERNWCSAWREVNAVLLRSDSSISIYQYPLFYSSVEKTAASMT